MGRNIPQPEEVKQNVFRRHPLLAWLMAGVGIVITIVGFLSGGFDLKDRFWPPVAEPTTSDVGSAATAEPAIEAASESTAPISKDKSLGTGDQGDINPVNASVTTKRNTTRSVATPAPSSPAQANPSTITTTQNTFIPVDSIILEPKRTVVRQENSGENSIDSWSWLDMTAYVSPSNATNPKLNIALDDSRQVAYITSGGQSPLYPYITRSITFQTWSAGLQHWNGMQVPALTEPTDFVVTVSATDGSGVSSSVTITVLPPE